MSARLLPFVGVVPLLATLVACEQTAPPAARGSAGAPTPPAAPAAQAAVAATAIPVDAQAVATAERSLGGAPTTPYAAASTARESGGTAAPERGDRIASPGASSAAPSGADLRADGPDAVEGERVPDRFPRPRNVRGLYVNAWAAGSSARMEVLLDVARRTEINTLVIDIKDASGYVSHRSEVPLANEVGATGEIRIRDLPGLLDRLEAEDIYPVARIVVIKDPLLAHTRPELAVNDTAGGVWIDHNGESWLNPHSTGVWDYHIAIAREVALLGFPEIQLDYVRFPDAPPEALGRAVFAGSGGQTKAEAITEKLLYVREQLADLGVQLTADVFGVTTTAARDVGIGQIWESVIDAVDVALPMVYPSHYYTGSYGYRVPNAHPYEVVKRALADAVRRSAEVEGAGRTIPWLQDFTLGEPVYAAAEVRAQIQAAYDVGIDEWILWNAGSHYTTDALEPDEGFAQEPFIRVAGVLAPVSWRYALLDSVAAARALEASARAAPVPPPVPTLLPVADSAIASEGPELVPLTVPAATDTISGT